MTAPGRPSTASPRSFVLSARRHWLARLILLYVALLPIQSLAREGVIYTTSYPLYYFASAIGGDALEVVFPAPPDVDPAFWKPSVDVLLGYQRAGLILVNGAGFERWLTGAALPRSRLVDTSAAFADRLIAQKSQQTPHVHGPEGAHAHASGTAFTTWLDLSLARLQAESVRAAMVARWPAISDVLATRHAALDARLARLDAQLEEAARVHAGRPLIASHPVYAYLARRYRLDVASLHWEPDIHPDEAAWRDFEALLAKRPASVMLWEGEPTSETRERLTALGVRIVVFPTVGNRPASGDFVSVLEEATARLVQP